MRTPRVPLVVSTIAQVFLISVAPCISDPLTVNRSVSLPPGCTDFYAYDGKTALGGNNEDFNNPMTYVWFVPGSEGRFGRVYFGYDDFLIQGGVNDQGVFFDGLALPYKAMPKTRSLPHFPGGDLALFDEILSRSSTVQDVIDLTSRWTRVAGEYAQYLFGDRFGDSVIIDGNTILRKQGSFQLATNFRLVDTPDPPYPDARCQTVSDMLSSARTYDVDLFRRALDAAHAEGGAPTLYSQVYELQTGKIPLYQYHDFQHEVVLDIASELAKGPHVVAISSLFPKNAEMDRWAAEQIALWKAGYEGSIDSRVNPVSLAWMQGRYLLREDANNPSVGISLRGRRLYLERADEEPAELFPSGSRSVFHHYFNGMDLTLTFARNLWGQATGAQGAFGFKPYGINIPYHLSRPGVLSYAWSLTATVGGACVVLIGLGLLILVARRRACRRERRTVR